MRVLAVTTEKRMPAMPDLPTLTEQGYKVQIGTGRGFAMPAGVPKEAAAVMEALLEKVHKSKRVAGIRGTRTCSRTAG